MRDPKHELNMAILTGADIGKPILEKYVAKVMEGKMTWDKAVEAVEKLQKKSRQRVTEAKKKDRGVLYALDSLRRMASKQALIDRIKEGIPEKLVALHQRCLEAVREYDQLDPNLATVRQSQEKEIAVDNLRSQFEKKCNHRFLGILSIPYEDTYGNTDRWVKMCHCFLCGRSLGEIPERGCSGPRYYSPDSERQILFEISSSESDFRDFLRKNAFNPEWTIERLIDYLVDSVS